MNFHLLVKTNHSTVVQQEKISKLPSIIYVLDAELYNLALGLFILHGIDSSLYLVTGIDYYDYTLVAIDDNDYYLGSRDIEVSDHIQIMESYIPGLLNTTSKKK